MINWKDFEGSGSCVILRLFPGIRLEGLRKTTKYPNKDSRFPVRELNPEPPEYEAGVSSTRPRRSVIFTLHYDAFCVRWTVLYCGRKGVHFRLQHSLYFLVSCSESAAFICTRRVSQTMFCFRQTTSYRFISNVYQNRVAVTLLSKSNLYFYFWRCTAFPKIL
jgi:hypothetical protein